MITVWSCPVCDRWRHKRWEEIGWLTNPRCDWCGTRMISTLRSRPTRSTPRVTNLVPPGGTKIKAA
jgi:hypothetical protein